ncbi:decaprenylphospho-beta-D-erythro-pentofuranosid-2-ulose 2-reductase [Undibacterium sp. GrIS 1.8]|uniref:SDR family NAD(P)-dependent oxidoreductase n=1 Tax=unclassified Undibacterium TaxID=2630295 RepID=UPI0033946D71
MSELQKKIVIVGGTSAIAEYCARFWVANATVDLTLVGRDIAKMERVAADLQVRSPQSRIRVISINFNDPKLISQTVESIQSGGRIDIALIAHGSLPDQIICQQDLVANYEALTINGISPVLFAEAFASRMQADNHGQLGIIGSVAGDRGRKSNYVYGSAKGLVEKYAQGLQHRLASSKVQVTLIKPGPTDTPMTAHLRQQGGKLARVEDVSKAVTAGIESGKAVVYAPGKWALIMLIVRNLPNAIFNKMDI